jgi:hypothetical protein
MTRPPAWRIYAANREIAGEVLRGAAGAGTKSSQLKF